MSTTGGQFAADRTGAAREPTVPSGPIQPVFRRLYKCGQDKLRLGRRGLSTLELVLCLPILLMVMALMVNFGVAVCWKVRALGMSRHVLWNTRWPRSGSSDPRPANWPLAANAGVRAERDLPVLDDPRVNHPVVRGPLPAGNQADGRLLDPARGLREATAELNRDYTMLPRMGPYHLAANTRLLDDKWQYQRMGLPANTHRRIPVIYTLARAPAGMVNAYVNGVVGLLQGPFRAALAPLDRDDEFLAWEGYAPDFHPRLGRFCDLDPAEAEDRVEQLVDRIRGKEERDSQGRLVRRIPSLAERMANSFIALYRRAIQRLQSVPGNEAQIATLEAKIGLLEQFRDRLRNTDQGSPGGTTPPRRLN